MGASQVPLVVKNLPANARDTDLIPGWGRSPGGRNSPPLQYSFWDNPLDRGAWRAIDHGVAKNQTWLSGEWPSGFPYFLQFKSDFYNRELMIWVSSWSCFCWLYRAFPSLAAKNIFNPISVLTIWWCPCVESSLVLLEEGVYYDQWVLLGKLC